MTIHQTINLNKLAIVHCSHCGKRMYIASYDEWFARWLKSPFYPTCPDCASKRKLLIETEE